MRPLATLLLVLSLVPASRLVGQTLYSPAFRAASEGNYDNSLPIGYAAATQSYLQLHGDLKGRPGVFTKIAFRRDGVLATNAAYAAKTFTADLFFGGGVDVTALVTTFAANYVTARTQVGTNKTYNIPDWSAQPAAAPAAFNVQCPLDVSYPWNGLNAFAWEMRVTAMSSTHAMFADAEKSPTGGNVTSLQYGTGCTATGQSFVYVAQGGFTSFDVPAPTTSFSWTCNRGVPSAPTVILLGVQSAVTPIPGLCADLQVVPQVTLSGTSGSNSMFSIAGTEPYDPAHAGVTLYWQCACLDSARTDPIAVAMSRGASATVPPVPRLACARLYDAGSATATVGTADPSGTLLGTIIRLD